MARDHTVFSISQSLCLIRDLVLRSLIRVWSLLNSLYSFISTATTLILMIISTNYSPPNFKASFMSNWVNPILLLELYLYWTKVSPSSHNTSTCLLQRHHHFPGSSTGMKKDMGCSSAIQTWTLLYLFIIHPWSVAPPDADFPNAAAAAK